MVDGTLYDLVVIGGGVVGLAVLRSATLHGWNCALVEAQPELLTQASGSNSGVACTGVDGTPGTLERALIRDANAQFRLYCKKHNLPTRPCGSLVCLWPWDEEDQLQKVLQESHDAGDLHARHLAASEVLEREPNLASSVRGAVHIPGEIVVDPWLYSISLGVHARENGSNIFTNFQVDPGQCHLQDGIWTIKRQSISSSCSNDAGGLQQLRAKCVVNAAGIFADLVQHEAHGSSPWMAKPRRGQYRIYQSTSKTLIQYPIQPVPSQFTKGIFVFSSLYNQLVVGPTALEQDSRTDRSVDPEVADDLDQVIQRILPHLNVKKDFVGEYVGIRPGTDRRDYQIHAQPHKKWIAVAGIRSTGLTASLGIGDYVRRLLESILEAPHPENGRNVSTTPLPPLGDLIRNFAERGDSRVEIQGHAYQVTHPLTRLGWEQEAILCDKAFITGSSTLTSSSKL